MSARARAWTNSNLSSPGTGTKLISYARRSLTADSLTADLSKVQLKSAVEACIKLSPKDDCSNGPRSTWTDAEWDVSSVHDMHRMVSYARLFKRDISKWDVSSVKDMGSMFLGATSFNRDISKWDVSSVVTMPTMFRWATCFNGDISEVGRVKRGKHGLHVLGCEVV